MKMRGLISVRLEGGIGDHILGLRLLPFIKKHYPRHKIIAYSDCGGHAAPAEVARMSPFLSEVIPVYHKKRFSNITRWGSIKNIRKEDLAKMMHADLFFDAWSEHFFIDSAKALGVPFYEILAERPKLIVPDEFKIKAAKFLAPYKGKIFVGLNVSKYGLGFFIRNKKIVLKFLEGCLKNKDVIILNFYTSDYQFPHWPIPISFDRQEQAQREYLKIGELWNIDKRVIPAVDFPVSLVAALIKRCSYFIGVDNGLKHLAWALRVPHTFFIPKDFTDHAFILRWMPDFHRHLLFNCPQKDFLRHLKEEKKAIALAAQAKK